MVSIKVEGTNAIKNLFDELGLSLNANQMVQILRPAGRAVVKSARNYVPQEGEIKRAVKRDIAIVKSKVIRGQAEVNIGLKFGYYDINNQVQKVAPIVRHMTQGFDQTNRTGSGGGFKSVHNRGKIKNRTGDFIEQGFENSKSEQIQAINEGVIKKIKRIQSKLK